MILNAARLERDPTLPVEPFGLIGWLQYAHLNPCDNDIETEKTWDGTTNVGAMLPPRHLEVVKTVELATTRDGLPTVVERLSYDAGSYLIPFKVRHRTKDKVASAVFPRGMTAIHYDLSGQRDKGCFFIDPRFDFMYAAVNQGPSIPIDRHDEFTCLMEYVSEIDILKSDTIAKEAMSQEAALDALSSLPIIMQRASGDDMRELARKFFQPPLLAPDALTVETMAEGTLSKKRLRLDAYSDAGLGALSAKPLSVPLGVGRETNGTCMDYNTVAQAIDELAVTDFDVRFSVGRQGLHPGQHIISFVDRYADIVRPDPNSARTDLVKLRTAVEGLLFPLSVKAARDTYQIRVAKTNGEEVLVEVMDKGGVHPEHAIHLDLAKLSLCSMGAANISLAE